jgi:hypothetical protein
MTDIFGTVHRMAEQLRFDAVTVFIFKWIKGYKLIDINGETKFFRRRAGYTLFDYTRNEEILEDLKVEIVND